MSNLDPELVPLIVALVACIALIAYGSWQAAKPHNSAQPRMIPWKTATLLLAVATIVLALNIASQMGFHAPSNNMAP